MVMTDDEQSLAALVTQRRTELGLDVDPEPRKLVAAAVVAPVPLTPEQEAVREARRQAAIARNERELLDKRLSTVFGNRARYRNCSLANFRADGPAQQKAARDVLDYCEAINARIAAGDGVLFFGPPGTGKDHLMAHMMNFAVRAGKSVKWVNGMDLFGEVRDRMDDERQTERQLVESHTSPQVLAISDPVPPFGELSAFQAAMLFRIIDGRYSARLPTWVTLNAASSDEANRRIGAQVVDRLTDGALVIPCNWPSHRKPKS